MKKFHHLMNTSGKPFIRLMLVNPSYILTDPAIFIVTEWLHTRTQRCYRNRCACSGIYSSYNFTYIDYVNCVKLKW